MAGETNKSSLEEDSILQIFPLSYKTNTCQHYFFYLYIQLRNL